MCVYHCASGSVHSILRLLTAVEVCVPGCFYAGECVRLCKVVVVYNHSVSLSLHTDKEELFQNVLTQVAEQFSR